MPPSPKTALLICNGEPPSPQLLGYFWKQTEIHIAVDGGANLLWKHQKTPDVIIGDLDSFNKNLIPHFQNTVLISVSEQETNDLDKAIRYCIEQHLVNVYLLGASGKRHDHFLANLEVLYKYSAQIKMFLWTEEECMQVIQKTWTGNLEIGSRLSLFPLFAAVHGVTTQGLEFALKNDSLIPGKAPSGLSNRVNAPVQICIEHGALLLITEAKMMGEFQE